MLGNEERKAGYCLESWVEWRGAIVHKKCPLLKPEEKTEDVSRDERVDGWYALDILGGD